MTAAEAILSAMQTFAGDVRIKHVEQWLSEHSPQNANDVGTAMADLTFPPSPSSGYAPERCFLHRSGRGLYRLRRQWRTTEEAEPDVHAFLVRNSLKRTEPRATIGRGVGPLSTKSDVS